MHKVLYLEGGLDARPGPRQVVALERLLHDQNHRPLALQRQRNVAPPFLAGRGHLRRTVTVGVTSAPARNVTQGLYRLAQALERTRELERVVRLYL